MRGSIIVAVLKGDRASREGFGGIVEVWGIDFRIVGGDGDDGGVLGVLVDVLKRDKKVGRR